MRRCGVNVADSKGFVDVAVDAVVKGANVNVHNVAVFEWPAVGDAVADDFVHGSKCEKGRKEARDLQRTRKN